MHNHNYKITQIRKFDINTTIETQHCIECNDKICKLNYKGITYELFDYNDNYETATLDEILDSETKDMIAIIKYYREQFDNLVEILNDMATPAPTPPN